MPWLGPHSLDRGPIARAAACVVTKWIMWGPCSPAPMGWLCMVKVAAGCCVPNCCHPECLLLQECQEMHGEFIGSACGHHGPYTPDVLFWSCILFFATFIVSSTLKTFKTSRYFPTRVGSTFARQSPFPAPCGCPSRPDEELHGGRLFQQPRSQLCGVGVGGGFKPLKSRLSLERSPEVRSPLQNGAKFHASDSQTLGM